MNRENIMAAIKAFRDNAPAEILACVAALTDMPNPDALIGLSLWASALLSAVVFYVREERKRRRRKLWRERMEW